MKESTPEERRRYVRINVAAKINFRVTKKESKERTAVSIKSTSAMSKNVSVEGVCFKSKKQLLPGNEIELQISFPSDPEPLLLKGEVRWSCSIQVEGEAETIFETGVKLYTFEKTDESRYLSYVSEKMMERLSRYLHL